MPDRQTIEEMLEVLEGRFFGKYRGRVVDNADPTGRGRLRVVVPAVLGEEEVWAMPCVPYAGDQVGFYALPEADVGVWVEFEAGDPSYPIWVGCFWQDGQVPQADSDPNVKFIRTGKVTLRIDDDAGEIEISTEGGSTLKITGTEMELKAQSINHEAGGKKTALTPASFDVADGAFTVV